MRNSKLVTISLPPNIAEELNEFAKKEAMTKSELARLALRRYLKLEKGWALIQKWGKESAKKFGLEKEKEVDKIVEQFREPTKK